MGAVVDVVMDVVNLVGAAVDVVAVVKPGVLYNVGIAVGTVVAVKACTGASCAGASCCRRLHWELVTIKMNHSPRQQTMPSRVRVTG